MEEFQHAKTPESAGPHADFELDESRLARLPPSTIPPRAQSSRFRFFSRPRFVHLLVALLCSLLGFAAVAQIRQQEEDTLAGMRQEDLVALIGELGTRSEQLEAEKQALTEQLSELRSSTSNSAAAQAAARERAQEQEILAGTVAVHGPGLILTIDDSADNVSAQTLYSVLQELRNAGAEAIALNCVRLSASSSITANETGTLVDGTLISAPYFWQVIGDSEGIETALNIPGGAIDQLGANGAESSVALRDDLTINAVRELAEPKWASVDSD